MQVFICYFGAFSCVKLKLYLMFLSVMDKMLKNFISVATDINQPTEQWLIKKSVFRRNEEESFFLIY